MSNLKTTVLETAKNENMEDTWAELKKVCAAIGKMDREKNANTTFDKMCKLIRLATTVQYLMMAPELVGTTFEEGANV